MRYKARLVAQGFSQVEGIDYFDTYAPVARLPSSRAIIAMANRLGLELHQVDIKGAYLNGELLANEILYMRHPPGYRQDASGCHEPEQDFVTIGNSSRTLRFSLAKITNTTQENF